MQLTTAMHGRLTSGILLPVEVCACVGAAARTRGVTKGSAAPTHNRGCCRRQRSGARPLEGALASSRLSPLHRRATSLGPQQALWRARRPVATTPRQPSEPAARLSHACSGLQALRCAAAGPGGALGRRRRRQPRCGRLCWCAGTVARCAAWLCPEGAAVATPDSHHTPSCRYLLQAGWLPLRTAASAVPQALQPTTALAGALKPAPRLLLAPPALRPHTTSHLSPLPSWRCCWSGIFSRRERCSSGLAPPPVMPAREQPWTAA